MKRYGDGRWPRLCVAVLSVACVASLAKTAGALPPETAREIRQLVQKDEYTQALARVDSLLKASPDDADLLRLREQIVKAAAESGAALTDGRPANAAPGTGGPNASPKRGAETEEPPKAVARPGEGPRPRDPGGPRADVGDTGSASTAHPFVGEWSGEVKMMTHVDKLTIKVLRWPPEVKDVVLSSGPKIISVTVAKDEQSIVVEYSHLADSEKYFGKTAPTKGTLTLNDGHAEWKSSLGFRGTLTRQNR